MHMWSVYSVFAISSQRWCNWMQVTKKLLAWEVYIVQNGYEMKLKSHTYTHVHAYISTLVCECVCKLCTCVSVYSGELYVSMYTYLSNFKAITNYLRFFINVWISNKWVYFLKYFLFFSKHIPFPWKNKINGTS